MENIKQFDNEIIQMYKSGLTGRFIAEKIKYPFWKVYKILNKNNIKKRLRKDYKKYKFQENYFEIIDSQQKAYWLGFLYADGYNCVKGKYVSMALQEKDLEILKKFKNHLNFNGPLTYKLKNNGQNQWQICICSGKFSKDLEKLGCVQAKSLILEFPLNLQSKFIRHFIRGYFDGDGWVTSGPSWGIVSTKNFCNTVNEILSPLIGIKNLENHPNNNITKIYRVSGRRQLKKIFHFLYKNATIYLKRKYNRFQNLLCT